MRSARLRFACLWLSLVARGLADWCLRLLALLAVAGPERFRFASAWHLTAALFIAPFLLLAPLNGCLSNSLPRRGVLVVSAALALLAVAATALLGGSWLLCLGLVAVASGLYSPARFAMLPAAATDTGILLPRLNGWAELGTAVAIVGGFGLGWAISGGAWPTETPLLDSPAVWLLLGLNGICLLAAIPVQFPSDLRRPELPLAAMAGFFRDLGRILAVRQARGYLLGLAAFQALVTAATGVLLARTLEGALQQGGLLEATVLLGLGAALGCAVASLQGNPRRSPGLTPPGLTGLLFTLVLTAAFTKGGAPLVPCLFLGFFSALVNVSLRAAYLAAVPADARGNGMGVMNGLIYLLTIVLALLLFAAGWMQWLLTPTAQLTVLALLTAFGTVLAWLLLFPQFLELLTELVLLPMYRMRPHGPGKDCLPLKGPLIVIANHAAYLDPFWLGKLFPAHLRPLMTSKFYDLPGVRWMMVHAVKAIRVPLGARREPEPASEDADIRPALRLPELREAVAALRQGDCLLIFPEGMLRRKEEPILRQFGQGIWHILRELPETPVLPVWIEGGWGSWGSYCNGPPITNKRLDWRRPINVAFGEPVPVPAEVLAHHRTTRAYLMRACLECRRYLGLEVPASGADSAESGNREEQEDLPSPADSGDKAHENHP